MAFVKKTWKNRVSEFFNRYRVENVQTGAISKVYMNLDDGAVTEPGDVIDADTMNDLENRIENALADVGKGSNWVGTTEEWEALTDEEKAEYDTYDLTDDFEGYGVTNDLTSGSGKVITSGGVANHLMAGERKFYFDYQDGKYGYNTSANRGADTFFPFSNIGELTAEQTVTIPKGTQRTSITFTNEANLILFYSIEANRSPSLYYKTTMLLGNTSSTASVVSIDSSGKTCVINIPSYASQYYAVNFI